MEDLIEDRENTMKFLQKQALEGADGAVVVLKKGDEVNALWYADAMQAYTMVCLAKDAIWRTITGQLDPNEEGVDPDPEDWDINKLQ